MEETVRTSHSEVVTALAQRPFHVDEWFAAAEARDDDFAAAMVGPPPPPDSFEATDWVQRVQVAAAMHLAHVHEETLFDLMKAPSDWRVTAAIIALLALARAHPERHDDVASALDARLKTADDEDTETPALVVCRLRLGGLEPPRARALWRRRRALFPPR
jgi:hypothetical protein